MTSWHPLFARLLRTVVEKEFELQTEVPVGDIPRQADFVLLRRTGTGPTGLHGVWTGLTTWNVLEYKGPTVSARVRDLDLLVEVGLGIDRRLNEERAKHQQRPLPPKQVSFWYLANRLGSRFLTAARARLGPLTEAGSGIWRCELLQRPLFLVSSVHLPVEQDNLPLSVLADAPPQVERAIVEFMLNQAALPEAYSAALLLRHHALLEEWEAMGKSIKSGLKLDKQAVRFILDHLNPEATRVLLDQFAAKELSALLDPQKRDALSKALLAEMSPEQRLDVFLASLTPEQRAELKRRLE